MGNKWTDEDVSLLKEWYEEEGPNCFKRFKGRFTKSATRHKAERVGLKHNGNKWQPHEIEILIKWYNKEGTKVGGRLSVQRNKATIVRMANKLGLKWQRDMSGKNNPMFGKKQKKETKLLIGTKNKGNSYAKGSKHPKLAELNRSRIGIPLKKEAKEKQRKSILTYWESPEGEKQKINLSEKNKQWAKENPEEKIKAAKKGHKSCPRISSLEKKTQNILETLNANFISQYEYKLGFADFLIKPNLIVFVDGNYWHNFPHGTEKDKKQTDWLKNNSYKVLRIWEHELKNTEKVKKKIIKFMENK